MTFNEPKKEQNVNPDANSKVDTSIPELPHPPHLPTPKPPGAVEPTSPTSSGSIPEPHFSAPGHLDPPV
jgi:hypothetical protein